MDSLIFSEHYCERAKSRGLYSDNKLSKYANEALVKGMRADDYKGKRREYLLNLVREKNREAIVYKNYVFIIAKNKYLITCFFLPDWFMIKNLQDSKKKSKRKGEKYNEIKVKRNFNPNY